MGRIAMHFDKFRTDDVTSMAIPDETNHGNTPATAAVTKTMDVPLTASKGVPISYLTTKIGIVAALAFAITACATTPGVPSGNGPVVMSDAGDVTAAVERYRGLLGGHDNGGTPGTQASGFRSLNWDKVPDEFAAPHNLPPGRLARPRRGPHHARDRPAGQRKAGQPGECRPALRQHQQQYPRIFKTFSPERLFAPIGSNVVEMTFFVPGTTTPAVVRGLGAVYTNARDSHTAFEFFDAAGKSLGKFQVPAAQEGLSFLGVAFPTPVVAHVRIEHGNAALGPDDGDGVNVAVMDDYIYGEPHAVIRIEKSAYNGYRGGYVGRSD
jgi:hypothetical protein